MRENERGVLGSSVLRLEKVWAESSLPTFLLKRIAGRNSSVKGATDFLLSPASSTPNVGLFTIVVREQPSGSPL